MLGGSAAVEVEVLCLSLIDGLLHKELQSQLHVNDLLGGESDFKLNEFLHGEQVLDVLFESVVGPEYFELAVHFLDVHVHLPLHDRQLFQLLFFQLLPRREVPVLNKRDGLLVVLPLQIQADKREVEEGLHDRNYLILN